MSKAYYQEISPLYPVVMCSEFFDQIEMEKISIDNEEAAYCLCSHLIKKGCKRLVYFHARGDSSSCKQRQLGIKRAVDTCGFTVETFFEPIQHKDKAFIKQVQEYQKAHQVDAMLINSDYHALYAMKALQGLEQHILVSSFDGTSYFELSNYAIPYIKQPFACIGTTAAEMLLDKIHGKAPELQQMFPFELIIP